MGWNFSFEEFDWLAEERIQWISHWLPRPAEPPGEWQEGSGAFSGEQISSPSSSVPALMTEALRRWSNSCIPLIRPDRILKYTFGTGQGLKACTSYWFGLRALEYLIYISGGMVVHPCDLTLLRLCDLWSHLHLGGGVWCIALSDWSISNFSSEGIVVYKRRAWSPGRFQVLPLSLRVTGVRPFSMRNQG